MKIILLNGPPGCGKDLAGEMIWGNAKIRSHFGNIHRTKFARVLKEMTHGLFGLHAPDDYYESEKNIPNADFGGLTPRQCYIAVSEKLIKPLFGNQYFGERVRNELLLMKRHIDLAVITDSGFASEVIPLIKTFGKKSLLHICLHRKGTSFKNDSRSYLRLPGVKKKVIHNDGTSLQLSQQLADAILGS